MLRASVSVKKEMLLLVRLASTSPTARRVMRETLRVDTSTVSSNVTERVSDVRSSEKLSSTGPVLSGSKAVTGTALSVSLGTTWFPAMSETSCDKKLRNVV